MSLLDGDHEGVVRIFVVLSCEQRGYLHYITRHNFSPTRSVTSGNRTPGSRSYSDLLDTLEDLVCIPPTRTQASFKALGCSFQLTHSHVMTVQLIKLVQASHGGQNEDKTLLQRSQRCHKGEFRHVSISVQQRTLRCGKNLRGPFLRVTLPMTVGSCARAMAINGRQKRSELHNRGEFQHNYYTF